MRSGARSSSDGSTSVEAGRRVGASVKSRLAQPPRIVDVFDALRPSVRARWVWRELYANYPSARHGCDGAEQWPWADRSISNRRKPRDSDRDVPSCVVTYPYPAKNISNLVPWLDTASEREPAIRRVFIPFTCDSLMAGRFSFGFWFWCWWALVNLARFGRVYV